MKKLFALLILSFLCITTMNAQRLMKQKERVFNFGVKAGLNSLMPDIRHIEMKGADLNNAQAIYNVGYSVELLARINMDQFFIQPSICWKYAQGDIQFNMVQPPLVGTNQPRILEGSFAMEVKSLELPVMIGYNIIKESPYVLGFLAGAKFKYNYDVSYSSTALFMDNEKNYYLSLYSAIEVIIGRLAFDFGYEYGLNKMNSAFNYQLNASEYSRPLKMKSRLNGLSMSIGMFF